VISVNVIGTKAVQYKLGKVAVVCGGENLERALVFGGLLGINRAKQIAPIRTGNLRRSLHIGGHSGASGGLVSTTGTDVGGNQHSPVSATVLAGTNVEYARYLEEGTSRMSARPYLRPAFDESAQAIAHEVGASMAAIIRAAVR